MTKLSTNTHYLLQSLTSPRSLIKLYELPQNCTVLHCKKFRLPTVLDKTPTNTQYLLQSLISPRSLNKLYKHPHNSTILRYKEFMLPKVLDKTPTNTVSFAELDLPKVLGQTLQTSSKKYKFTIQRVEAPHSP